MVVLRCVGFVGGVLWLACVEGGDYGAIILVRDVIHMVFHAPLMLSRFF